MEPKQLYSQAYGSQHSRESWVKVSLAWLGVIAFSSTTFAGQWADRTFGVLMAAVALVLPLHQASLYHRFAYVAEKSVHVTMFFVLALVLWHAAPRKWRNPLLITVAGTLIGIGSEYLQSLFPGRDPALRDVIINATATAVGAFLISLKGTPASAESES